MLVGLAQAPVWTCDHWAAGLGLWLVYRGTAPELMLAEPPSSMLLLCTTV